MATNLTERSITAARTITLGGNLTVNRLGFGAMRVTGEGIFGEPPDREEAKKLLRRAYELGANIFDTADSSGRTSASCSSPKPSTRTRTTW